jgi:hypothetical protein
MKTTVQCEHCPLVDEKSEFERLVNAHSFLTFTKKEQKRHRIMIKHLNNLEARISALNLQCAAGFCVWD